jgi:hypothetical protein
MNAGNGLMKTMQGTPKAKDNHDRQQAERTAR